MYKRILVLTLLLVIVVTPVWACEGWVLLSPWINKDGTARHEDPYTKWRLEESFDTVKDCKGYKSVELKASQARLRKAMGVGNDMVVDFEGRNYRGWASSVCVPAYVFYGKGE